MVLPTVGPPQPVPVHETGSVSNSYILAIIDNAFAAFF